MFTKIAHISDIHLGKPQGWLGLPKSLAGHHDKHNAQRLRRIVNTIKGLPGYESILTLVTGDVTDRSTATEYKEAMGLLQGLKNIEMVPGNHDVTSVVGQGMSHCPLGARRYAIAHHYITGAPAYFPYVRDYGKWRLLCLDSSAHGERGTLFARGRIGARQLQWLAVQLDLYEQERVQNIIALHHYPAQFHPTLAISDVEDFLDIVNRRNVQVLFGHRHVFGLYHEMAGRPRLIAACSTVESMQFRLIDPVSRRFEVINVK